MEPIDREGSSDTALFCPLCSSAASRECHKDKRRSYYRCPVCDLIFVPPHQHLSADAERERYDRHQNSWENAGYRRHLERLSNPFSRLLAPGSRGLDFGSGPVPVLAGLFEQAGHRMARYDRFYDPDTGAFARQYDFITACEVIEHLRDPGMELERLWSCLKPGGVLGIQTQMAGTDGAFTNWHYKNDLTHVCFYSRGTFAWLGARWGAELTFTEDDVVLIGKDPAPFQRTR